MHNIKSTIIKSLAHEVFKSECCPYRPW